MLQGPEVQIRMIRLSIFSDILNNFLLYISVINDLHEWKIMITWEYVSNCKSKLGPVWPDWAIYWTLDNFLRYWATMNLPKSPTFLGIYCQGVKIYNFSSEIIFGQLL